MKDNIVDDEVMYAFSSKVYINMEELESAARKYDKYYDTYDMVYEVKKLKEAIISFGNWFEENKDKVNTALEEYHLQTNKNDKEDVDNGV